MVLRKSSKADKTDVRQRSKMRESALQTIGCPRYRGQEGCGWKGPDR